MDLKSAGRRSSARQRCGILTLSVSKDSELCKNKYSITKTAWTLREGLMKDNFITMEINTLNPEGKQYAWCGLSELRWKMKMLFWCRDCVLEIYNSDISIAITLKCTQCPGIQIKLLKMVLKFQKVPKDLLRIISFFVWRTFSKSEKPYLEWKEVLYGTTDTNKEP